MACQLELPLGVLASRVTFFSRYFENATWTFVNNFEKNAQIKLRIEGGGVLFKSIQTDFRVNLPFSWRFSVAELCVAIWSQPPIIPLLKTNPPVPVGF